MIGKLRTDKGLNRNTVRGIISKELNIMNGLVMTEVGLNQFLFLFNRAEDCARILRDEPWTIMGNLLIVK